MWWKIYFGLTILLLGISILDVFSPPVLNLPVEVFLIITYCIALVGLYTYRFKRHFFPQKFWKYYFWFYLVLDIVYLALGILPSAYLKAVSFLLVYDSNSVMDAIIDTALDIPLLYALYQLSRGEVYIPRPKKKTPFRWGMVQTALWGYSSILTLFFFLLSFFPQSGVDNSKPAFNPFFTLMFAPLLIFWVWVLIQYKEYHWNWWRTTLLANALLYSGSIIFGLIFPQQVSGSSGFDVISVLQLSILLVSFYVFGRDQVGIRSKSS
jgi:hypothetical protein